ncbi:hypothetical protein [Clostridium sp. Cult1]|uniref:hypothetical protein n=1 Tax=Clostridium sp. Cult1 TaxID=2079002 RepID=UPI001F24E91B|nr:hypothetical protein [Clostridium sp. Cult1]MCF6463248.1 hypothetical protein [Clostridium sp. Cult1]
MKFIYNYLEKVLIFLSICSLMLLLIIQFIDYNNKHSIFTSIDFDNNKFFNLSGSTDYYEKGIIILKNMTPNFYNIEVLVNGQYAGDFTKNDEIKINVYHNDLVEIDGTKYNDKLTIKVVGVSSNLDMPKLDTIITTSQSIEILSKVQLK